MNPNPFPSAPSLPGSIQIRQRVKRKTLATPKELPATTREASDERIQSNAKALVASATSEAVLLALVARAQEGDTEAFGKVYDHFFLPIYRYTAFRAPEEMVEDLVSDIFVKAWEKLALFTPRKNIPFGAWLFRIARYTVIDAYRARRDTEEISEEVPDHDDFNRADASVRMNDTLRIVQKALSELPRRYREVLLLSFVADLPNREVARTLRMTEGGVRILKMRALRKLEKLLPPEIADRA